MKKFSAVFYAVIIILGGICLANATSYMYAFSVDEGPSSVITPYAGTESAVQYYNFSGASGFPAFGPEEGMAFFWLWHETDTDALSLNVIFSEKDLNSTGAGRAFFTLSGLPAGWSWSFQDDNADIGDAHDLTPTWTWNTKNTDGGVIGGLENSAWDIIWTATNSSNNFYGITDWYFLSAGKGKYDHKFSMSTGSELTVSSSAVPEPTTMVLLGLGLLGLAGIGRKKFLN